MKHYSTHAIEMFTRHVNQDTEGSKWLMTNGYQELLATLEAIRDDKKAFKFLMDNKYFELAAFVNAIWDDSKAFKVLLDKKAIDWAACANIINGDDKAKEALIRVGKPQFINLAIAIQRRIHEDGDRNVSPWGVFKNLFNLKKHKDEDN
jgi:nicotinic acid phosphoribosyltransferase